MSETNKLQGEQKEKERESCYSKRLVRLFWGEIYFYFVLVSSKRGLWDILTNCKVWALFCKYSKIINTAKIIMRQSDRN